MPTGPRSVYGLSKLAGEQAIRTHCPDHLICRIAWLYGAGGPSFVHTMLKLGAQGGDPLKVVNDQHGNPTSCDAVAAHIRRLLDVPSGWWLRYRVLEDGWRGGAATNSTGALMWIAADCVDFGIADGHHHAPREDEVAPEEPSAPE